LNEVVNDLSDLFGICPYVTTQKILTGKWKLIILFLLSERTMRFNELSKRMPGVTQATLTSHLRDLQKYGMIERHVYPEVPARVEYLMTGLGREFTNVLDAVNSFGRAYISKQGFIVENPLAE
jgi:DNA-binding HxlR family transcriptional regulator